MSNALTQHEIVKRFGEREYHYGTGYTATLPDGALLTVTPGDHDTYTAPGFYLAVHAPDGTWLWGRRFANVYAALAAARDELRTTRSKHRSSTY